MKTLNHIGSHIDIKAYSKMGINEMFTLINPMESYFRAPLMSKNTLNSWWCENPGSMSSSLSTPKIQFVCSLKSACSVCPFLAPKKNRNLYLHLCIYTNKYIHIYHILPLDLMCRLSELGWTHKKSSNNICSTPLWTTMQKIK